ncbi:MAG TPA: aminoacyl-tRNA hydrolase [Actinopolymorphaceae bacterium]
MTGGGWAVVGLGNPGPDYAATRHNIGFLVVDELARRAGSAFKRAPKLRSDVAEVRIGPLPGIRAVLAKPRTYMNDSGSAVSNLLRFYSTAPDHLLVVQDEIDLPFEAMRVKFGGGDNGHNGLKSIRASISSGEYYRVRLGIGRPDGRGDVADRVLSNFARHERDVLPAVIERAADAVEVLLDGGLDVAQQRFNS